MKAFATWFAEANGHLVIANWLKRDTAGFLEALEEKGRKPATINRAFRTLRTFVRWMQRRPDNPLMDDPVSSSMERREGRREPSKLADSVMWSLLKAADNLVLTEAQNKNGRPVRNRAILIVLQETGLRVSEMCNLQLGQYSEKYFHNVKRKGNRVDEVYVPKKARTALEEYLGVELERSGKARRPKKEPLLLSGRGGSLTRRAVAIILDKLADEAGKYSGGGIKIHPHMLRHTYGSKMMAKTKSESQTADFLGHSSTKYTGMYIGLTKSEREALMDED